MDKYEEILAKMQNKYKELTGTDPDEASDIGIRLKVLAAELLSAYAELNWMKQQMFPHTASGVYLDMHADQRGITRKEGAKATGEVEIFLSYAVNYDVTIRQGTILSTSGTNPVRFETTEDVTITSGRLSTLARIIALEKGADGNVAEQTINQLATPISGISSVTNFARTENGADAEDDESLRKRILESFSNVSNGTNKAFYRAEALAVEGVASVGVIPRNRGVGTVDVFIADANGESPRELQNAVASRLQTAREVNVDISVRTLEIIPVDVYLTLETKDGYDFDVVKANCETAIRQYFNTLQGGQTVYLSDIGEAVTHVEGVKNYTFVHQRAYDTEISEDKAARCGEITITERE